MSKILINALSAQLGGGQTHLLNVYNSNHDLWKNDDLLFIVSASNAATFEKEFGKEKIINIGPIGNNFFLRGIWENFQLSRLALRTNSDFVFLAGGLAPFFMSSKCKWVTISHNLLPYSWKSIFQSKGWGLRLKLILIRYFQLWSFQNTDGVIFTSIHAKNVISNFFNKKVKNTVIPSGINQMFFDRVPEATEDDYILYVSTFFEYKHQKEILIGFQKFLEKQKNKTKLIFIGNNLGRYGDECKKLAIELGINEFVIFKGNIPYNELPRIMQHSKVNIFASDCENCPNILLEYLASGAPILCSNFEPMPEFGKDFVTYFDPTNPDSFLQKLEIMLEVKVPLSNESLDQVKELYSWKLAAEEIKKFFHIL